MVVFNRRPQHPAFFFDQVAYEGVAVIGLGFEFTAEFGFGVAGDDREIILAVKLDDQRAVVGDELGRRGQDEQHEKYPHRDIAAPVGLEIAQPPSRHRGEPDRHSLNLAPLEIDARVDHHIHHVADQIDHQPEQSEDEQSAEDDRIVPPDERLIAEQTKPIE